MTICLFLSLYAHSNVKLISRHSKQLFIYDNDKINFSLIPVLL